MPTWRSSLVVVDAYEATRVAPSGGCKSGAGGFSCPPVASFHARLDCENSFEFRIIRFDSRISTITAAPMFSRGLHAVACTSSHRCAFPDCRFHFSGSFVELEKRKSSPQEKLQLQKKKLRNNVEKKKKIINSKKMEKISSIFFLISSTTEFVFAFALWRTHSVCVCIYVYVCVSFSLSLSHSLPSLVIRRPRYHGNGCRYVENVDEVDEDACRT